MECLYCRGDLEWEDSYGNRDYIIFGNISGKIGNIYKCTNENCESDVFDNIYHTIGNDDSDDLIEGYPC